VLEEVKKKSRFGKKMPAGKGQGVAVMELSARFAFPSNNVGNFAHEPG